MTSSHGSGSSGPGHETRDINIRGAALLTVGILLSIPLTLLVVDLLFGYFSAREARNQAAPMSLVPAEANRLPPEPRLQATPVIDLAKYRQEQETLVNGYGWVDRSAGTVRIPLARAMEMVLAQGVPTRPEHGAESGAVASAGAVSGGAPTAERKR